MTTNEGYVVRIVLGGPTDSPTEESRLLLNATVTIDASVAVFDLATGLLYVTDVRSLCVSVHVFWDMLLDADLNHTLRFLSRNQQYNTQPSTYFKIKTRTPPTSAPTTFPSGDVVPIAGNQVCGPEVVLTRRLDTASADAIKESDSALNRRELTTWTPGTSFHPKCGRTTQAAVHT